MEVVKINGNEYVPISEIVADESKKLRKAVNLLSYSERTSIKDIIEKLEGDEGVLVMQEIAKENNVARSVIVNTLIKLEFAGLVESKSLGMKGTHVRILNKNLIEEVKNM